jgi:hypothetical protein
MSSLFIALFAFVASSFRTRAALQAEILALRHQLAVFQKNAPRRLHFQRSDRFLWVLLSRWWPGWRRSLHIVRPDTVIGWHRRTFAWYWTRKSRRRPGRPNVAAEIRNLIRNMSQANPLWGAPRIHGDSLGTNGRPQTLGGTSAAAPFVTGTIALLWSAFPTAAAAQIKLAVTQGSRARRETITPPLLDAWAAYQLLATTHGRRRAS